MDLHTLTRSNRNARKIQLKTYTKAQVKNKVKVKRKRDEEEPEENDGKESTGEINDFQSPCVRLIPLPPACEIDLKTSYICYS